jgi:hypothetical protein
MDICVRGLLRNVHHWLEAAAESTRQHVKGELRQAIKDWKEVNDSTLRYVIRFLTHGLEFEIQHQSTRDKAFLLFGDL